MNKIVACFLLIAGAVCAQELIPSTRFDTTTTPGVTYIGKAMSNHKKIPISTNSAMWKIIKIDDDGVYNLEVGGLQGYYGVWADLATYTNAAFWK
jgi:hypothetical protein